MLRTISTLPLDKPIAFHVLSLCNPLFTSSVFDYIEHLFLCQQPMYVNQRGGDMEFGDKIKAARLAAEMTQEVLAEKVGVSRRTIMFYEMNKRKPKNAAMVISLAKALNVRTDYFLTDDELAQIQEQDAFLEQAGEQYGNRGKAQARLILDQASALFAGGELSEDDKEAFFQTMTEIYFDAKAKAKKYTPRKYRDDDID